jgi:hypothetical protein
VSPAARRPPWIEALEEQLAELQDLGREVFVGLPASDDAISACESALGVVLPASYRDLVATYGWLELGGVAIFGLEKAEVQTLSARALSDLPTSCVVVEIADAQGALLCLDTAQPRADGESAIIRFQPAGQVVSLQGAALSDWVSALVAVQLKTARAALAPTS